MGRMMQYVTFAPHQKTRPQKKGLKALDYGSPWNATAFPKVFFGSFCSQKEQFYPVANDGLQIAEAAEETGDRKGAVSDYWATNT